MSLAGTLCAVVSRPYCVNLGKRLVKSPKVCFMDSGLLRYPARLRGAHGQG